MSGKGSDNTNPTPADWVMIHQMAISAKTEEEKEVFMKFLKSLKLNNNKG
jgi:hypothetical protein